MNNDRCFYLLTQWDLKIKQNILYGFIQHLLFFNYLSFLNHYGCISSFFIYSFITSYFLLLCQDTLSLYYYHFLFHNYLLLLFIYIPVKKKSVSNAVFGGN